METLAILLLGWIIFGTILTIIGRFVYSKLLEVPCKDGTFMDLNSPDPSSPAAAAAAAAAAAGSTPSSVTSPTTDKAGISNTERFINTLKSHPPPTLPKLSRSKRSGSIDPQQQQQHGDVPSVAGSNSDCVKWVTNCLAFVYSRAQVWSDVSNSWKESLNDHCKRSEIEVG